MSGFIRMLCYIGTGVVMTISGYNVATWQYWAILGSLVVCDISHAFD